jgi:hypothetical protein
VRALSASVVFPRAGLSTGQFPSRSGASVRGSHRARFACPDLAPPRGHETEDQNHQGISSS